MAAAKAAAAASVSIEAAATADSLPFDDFINLQAGSQSATASSSTSAYNDWGTPFSAVECAHYMTQLSHQ